MKKISKITPSLSSNMHLISPSELCGVLFQRQRYPAAFVKFDLESQSPFRNKFGRCVPVQFGNADTCLSI